MGIAFLAEKLRVAVEEEDIPYQEQQPLGNLTATFGVATFPEDADDSRHETKSVAVDNPGRWRN